MKMGMESVGKVSVLTPPWWDAGKRYIGFTDAVDSYCCSPAVCWYVVVPLLGYEGYFHRADLVLLERGD